MIFIKVHKSYRDVVAVCDPDLIGRSFEEGEKCLKVGEHFFKGEEVSYERAVEMLRFQAKEDSTFDIVGKESIKAAKEAGIINDKSVGYIGKIPYALVLL